MLSLAPVKRKEEIITNKLLKQLASLSRQLLLMLKSFGQDTNR